MFAPRCLSRLRFDNKWFVPLLGPITHSRDSRHVRVPVPGLVNRQNPPTHPPAPVFLLLIDLCHFILPAVPSSATPRPSLSQVKKDKSFRGKCSRTWRLAVVAVASPPHTANGTTIDYCTVFVREKNTRRPTFCKASTPNPTMERATKRRI